MNLPLGSWWFFGAQEYYTYKQRLFWLIKVRRRIQDTGLLGSQNQGMIILMAIFYCELVPSGQCGVALRYSRCDTHWKVKNLFITPEYTWCTGNIGHSAFLSGHFCVWSSIQEPVAQCRAQVFLLSIHTGNAAKTLENPEPKMCPWLWLMGAEITEVTSVSQTFPLVLHKRVVREGPGTNYSQHAGMCSAEPGTWAKQDLSGTNTLYYIATPSHFWWDLEAN